MKVAKLARTPACIKELLQPDIATVMNGVCEEVPSGRMPSFITEFHVDNWHLLSRVTTAKSEWCSGFDYAMFQPIKGLK